MVFCVRKWIYPGTLVDVRPAAGTGLPLANPYAVGVKVWYKWRASRREAPTASQGVIGFPPSPLFPLHSSLFPLPVLYG